MVGLQLSKLEDIELSPPIFLMRTNDTTENQVWSMNHGIEVAWVDVSVYKQ